MSTLGVGEQFIPVVGGRVWCRIAGGGDQIPLLVLHGGPGMPHDYLEPLVGLTDERPVIFYDQLGCGRSDRPNDPSLWQIERFVTEVGQVREALGLTRVHILGHSAGSILAADYALRQPLGLKSLILASPALSVPKTIAEITRLRATLPEEAQETLQRHETAGTTDAEEYRQAVEEFDRRYGCRLQPPPECLQRAKAGLGQQVFRSMWGPSEIYCTGNLKEYDCTARLGAISLPLLFTCGRYDECPPEVIAWYHSLVAGSQMVVFEHSAHTPHLEESDRYLQVIRDFLRQAEAREKSQTPVG